MLTKNVPMDTVPIIPVVENNNYNLVKPISEYFCLFEIYEELEIEYIDLDLNL